MKSAINYKLINIVLFLIAVFFIIQMREFIFEIINYIFNILIPFLMAFIITYFLYPIVTFIKRKAKLNKNLSIIIVLIFTTIIMGAVIKVTIPLIVNLSKQIISFINNTDLNFNIINFNDTIDKTIDSFNRGFISFISSSINMLIKILTTLVLIIYFLFNYETIKDKIIKYSKDKPFYQCLKNIDYELSSYISGVGLIMLVEVVEYSIIYFLIGHPNFLLLALLSSVTTVIPFFGGLLTNTIALLTASFVSKKLFILTAIIVIIMPIFDSYLIQPRIYKKTNKFPPLLTIIIVIAGGMLFKFIGVMIAIPVFIIISNIVKTLTKRKL